MATTNVMRNVYEWIEQYSGTKLDLGNLLCDRHLVQTDRDAVIFEGEGGRSERMSYPELRAQSLRLAGSLRDLGVKRGDCVAVMLPKLPELVVTLLAIWRLGAVHVPLFTAFGPDAVGYRIGHSSSRLLITDVKNFAKLPADTALDHIVCVGTPPSRARRKIHHFDELTATGEPIAPVLMSGTDPFILIYTSGTTGLPKGVQAPIRSLAFTRTYMRYGLDVRPEDRYWNMADPGWAYGLWFAVVGPLLLGRTVFLRDVKFDAVDTLDAVTRHRITNMASAPTAYRAIRAAGVPDGFLESSNLRRLSSAGEPLNPELLAWSQRELGVPIHDHYGQTELGMALGHHHHPDVHCAPVPGCMGRPMPGFRMVVLDEQGHEVRPDIDGELAVDTEQSPLFCFSGYFKDVERTRERFPFGSRYYLTGDAARVGEDGLFRFASRADDVILSAGYRIGPFEIESVLMTHPNVAEVAVVGTKDELRGEAVTAFVVPANGEPTEGLAAKLQQLVKSRLAAHMYPRHVVFVDALPKTPSGKIQRKVLRDSWEATPALA